MEIIKNKRKQSYLKKKKINSSKGSKSPVLILGKDTNEDIPQEELNLNKVRKRKIKFNSIDDSHLFKEKRRNIDEPSSLLIQNNKQKNEVFKNENYVTNYLDKLYDDEPHLRKGLFRKKSSKINNKMHFRKVAFLSPRHNNKNTNQNINLLKLNKSSNVINNENNKKNNYKSNNKTRIYDYKDFLGEQSYGYDKKYNLIDSSELMLKSDIITNSKGFKGRIMKRKQTSKTNKSNKKEFYMAKFNNQERKKSNGASHIFYNSSKKQITNKSKEKFKKKDSKASKDKNYNKDKNNNNYKIENINNNINLFDEDKEKNVKKNLPLNNKKEKNEDNTNLRNSKKNKKNQDLYINNNINNIETTIQIEQQNNQNNNKKGKNKSCCFPFLVCLKIINNEDNENIL